MSDLNEAVAEVREAATEHAAEQVAAVVEHAQAEVQAAQDNAAAIARAAMETELGRQIEENRKEILSWQEKLSLLTTQVTQVLTDMSEMKATQAASLTLQVATQNPPANPALVSLTPAVSEVKEAVETVTASLPGNLSESAVEESPVPKIPKARKLFL